MDGISKLISIFITEKKRLGVSDEEINKVLFVASNVVMENSLKELGDSGKSDAIKEIQKVSRVYFQNPNDLDKLKSAESIVVNNMGETFGSVLKRNLETFLNQL
ncbi:hypothetical protein A2627_05870 [Candidatus Woesebacteria bacterium RIFCSPHIGHO2_01_FULL_39_28]|uniref:Uncharacterized protein n=1 Tax=Candidatus Woesebacteria bacterium RIFCSPHIGHO2_01_FULL_39_28 TaxID=1802496 RepID=A0A1F7YGK4_9BACT|nr:MAG: hypothetical protein A2627_05870 [Candidatus Woesebacteria bacterium RIFCSPHIGHO2_01_FULL_39_28]OGM57443.1 MAG: hypothetical protein A3A50_05935 [Candidatus Woesebacteria bacterium RIFCSPLOWO2_01_FULL_38_20]